MTQNKTSHIASILRKMHHHTVLFQQCFCVLVRCAQRTVRPSFHFLLEHSGLSCAPSWNVGWFPTAPPCCIPVTDPAKMICVLLYFYRCGKHHVQKPLGEGRVYLAYSSLSILKGSQIGNYGAKWRHNRRRGHKKCCIRTCFLQFALPPSGCIARTSYQCGHCPESAGLPFIDHYSRKCPQICPHFLQTLEHCVYT